MAWRISSVLLAVVVVVLGVFLHRAQQLNASWATAMDSTLDVDAQGCLVVMWKPTPAHPKPSLNTRACDNDRDGHAELVEIFDKDGVIQERDFDDNDDGDVDRTIEYDEHGNPLPPELEERSGVTEL